MLFHEVYGTYFEVLSEILAKAVDGELTEDNMYRIIREKGFEESVLTIPQNLQEQVWPLLKSDLTTPLAHEPTQPITTLQKRWMKALLNDPRIRLFAPPVDGLEDVEPLYPADAIVYFDQYGDGDPYDDPRYLAWDTICGCCPMWARGAHWGSILKKADFLTLRTLPGWLPS